MSEKHNIDFIETDNQLEITHHKTHGCISCETNENSMILKLRTAGHSNCKIDYS